MVASKWTSWCCSIIALSTSRFPTSFQFITRDQGIKKPQLAGWSHVLRILHIDPITDFLILLCIQGSFLHTTIPFLNGFIEVYFVDQNIVHLGKSNKWSVSKYLGIAPSPNTSGNTFSSHRKHCSCSFPHHHFQLWATTGLISTSLHNGLHSSPDKSRFPFSDVSSSLCLLI